MIKIENLKKDCLIIHAALHTEVGYRFYLTDGVMHQRSATLAGLRSFNYHNKIQFVEQNPEKTSTFAQRARQGEKITWGIVGSNWILIEGEGDKVKVDIPDRLLQSKILAAA